MLVRLATASLNRKLPRGHSRKGQKRPRRRKSAMQRCRGCGSEGRTRRQPKQRLALTPKVPRADRGTVRTEVFDGAERHSPCDVARRKLRTKSCSLAGPSPFSPPAAEVLALGFLKSPPAVSTKAQSAIPQSLRADGIGP